MAINVINCQKRSRSWRPRNDRYVQSQRFSLQQFACAFLQLAAATFADIGGYYFDLSQNHDD